ncbi:7-cyano-7-deazaguanine synthase [Candidatus Pacearchaeota archaeon]|nr:7-cyano-7-deazaguanine synthase [Candidatus Pacearchaeota archaeon]
MKQAIILCSGGLDSVVTAYYAKKKLDYEKIIILFFDYGQRNVKAERKRSKRCAEDLKVYFHEIKLKELGALSTSLLNSDDEAKKISRKYLKDSKKESEKWYVPCRNLVFLSYALALAESDFVKNKIRSDIFVGFKNEGKEGYPDTSEKFVNLINSISSQSTAGKFKVKAPLIKKDKEDIVSLGLKFDVDFTQTFSCYASNKKHCGVCLACRLRQEGFYWANVKDPTEYVKN